jgi:hypothetical protein
MPAFIEGVRTMASSFPVSAMIVGGLIIFGGVTPAMVRPVLEGTVAEQWLGRLQQPVRILCEPDDPGRPHEAWMRLPAADRGHDLQLLVDTGGDIEADHLVMGTRPAKLP